MSYETLNDWVQKAKKEEIVTARADGILVIRRVDAKDKAKAIIAIAEKLTLLYTKLFDGKRDAGGMLIHPAKIRGMALNVAQSIVRDQEQKATA